MLLAIPLASVPSTPRAVFSAPAIVARADVSVPVDEDDTASHATSEAHWVIAPYLWMYGMDGSVSLGGTTADFDVGFDEILENLDFALQGHVEYWNGPRGFFFDGQYGELSAEGSAGPIDLEVENSITLIEAGFITQLHEREVGADGGRHVRFDGFVGARYYDLDLEVDFAPPALATADGEKDWVDLIVGARGVWDLTRQLALTVRGDIGGFGIEGSSDLAWQTEALLGWRLSPVTTLAAGYRLLDIDYDRGDFAFDTAITGPVIGAVFRF
jgi:hypothetical protein